MTRLAGLKRSFPTFRLMTTPIRWIGRSRRRIWTAALVLLAMAASPPIWWAAQLMGLPDIGDPFDVAAFEAMRIPDDRNAFVLYHQAADKLKPWDYVRKPRVNMSARWSKAHPDLHRWAGENGEALALYRQGTERPDALDLVSPSTPEYWNTRQTLNYCYLLALLEASHLEEQGDMAGAWGWYRADLRAAHHFMRHGTISRWIIAQVWHKMLQDRLTSWAADPRTTPAMLRQALDDVIGCESLAPSESYMVKAEYLELKRFLDNPEGPGREVPVMTFRRLWWDRDYELTPEQMQAIWDAWRFWRREPERSRRVIRLMIANWLAYYDMPPGARPKPDLNTNSAFDFYPIGPGGPAKARILSPQSLDRWLESTCDANSLLTYSQRNRVRSRVLTDHRDLLILLGTQLYRRDHGTDPPTPEALVGPYLKSLPSEIPDFQKDESLPKVGEVVK